MRIAVTLALLLFSSLAFAGAKPGALKDYTALEVLEVENQRNDKGQKIPDEYVPELREQIIYGIVADHLFRRVGDHIDSRVPEPANERVAQMKVRVTGYSGAQNKAGVKTVVQLIDKQSGAEIFSSPVNATLRYDMGALTASLRKLSRSIAQLVRESR